MAATIKEMWDAIGAELVRVADAGSRDYGSVATAVNVAVPPAVQIVQTSADHEDETQQFLAEHQELVEGLLFEEVAKVNESGGELELPSPEQMAAAVGWIVERRVAAIGR